MSLKLHNLSRNGKSYVPMLCFLITYLSDFKKAKKIRTNNCRLTFRKEYE